MDAITVERVLAWKPRAEYGKAELKRLIGRGLTLEQLLRKPIPAADRLWVATRPGVLTPEQCKKWLDIIVNRAVQTHNLRRDGRYDSKSEEEKKGWAEKYLFCTDRSAAAVCTITAEGNIGTDWDAVVHRLIYDATVVIALYAGAEALDARVANPAAYFAWRAAADAAADAERSRQIADLLGVLHNVAPASKAP